MLSQAVYVFKAADKLPSCVQGPARAERVELPMLPSIAPGNTIEQFPGSCSEFSAYPPWTDLQQSLSQGCCLMYLPKKSMMKADPWAYSLTYYGPKGKVE